MNLPVMGGLSHLEDILQRHDISGVVLALPARMAATLPELLMRLEKFPLDDLPDDVRQRLELGYSTIMVARRIEIWQQHSVVNAADARLERNGEPVP